MKPDLYEYLRERAHQSFDISNNNCVHFTNKCWEIEHGKPWCEEFNRFYSITQTEWDTALDAASSALQRVYEPKEGDLVLLEMSGSSGNPLKGYICGFCLGDLSVFLGDKGLKYLPTKKLKLFWRNND